MQKQFDLSRILVKGAQLEVVNLEERNGAVARMIEETKAKQAEILKLKEVDEESLKKRVGI